MYYAHGWDHLAQIIEEMDIEPAEALRLMHVLVHEHDVEDEPLTVSK